LLHTGPLLLPASDGQQVERTVALADDCAAPLTTDATAAREFFDGLSYSQKRWFTLGWPRPRSPRPARAHREVVGMAALLPYVIAIGSSAIMPPLGADALNRLFERLVALVRIGTAD
jgi:hypothetical protein